MKHIVILRHADRKADELTPEGIVACKKLAQKLPHFDIVIASPAHRTQQTAELLANTKPATDPRAALASGQAAAEDLLELVKDLIQKLPLNGQALIVSHEVNILALIRLLSPVDTVRSIGKLDGVSLDENLNMESVSNGN